MTSVFFTYPLEIIRVRMAYQTRDTSSSSTTAKPSFLTTFSKIYHESPQPLPPPTPPPSTTATPPPTLQTPLPPSLFNRFPLLKFYRGFSATTIGMIPYAGMSFLTWDFLRSHFLPPPPTSISSSSSQAHLKPTPLFDLSIGAISGALAQTVSYPFEIIRRRMQVGGITQPDRLLGFWETVGIIWRGGGGKKGWRGFYVGLSIGYLKVVPMTAVSFAVWQGMKRVLGV
jgi:solute carrier family 25 (mitochondrial carrier protein), member 16